MSGSDKSRDFITPLINNFHLSFPLEVILRPLWFRKDQTLSHYDYYMFSMHKCPVDPGVELQDHFFIPMHAEGKNEVRNRVRLPAIGRAIAYILRYGVLGEKEDRKGANLLFMISCSTPKTNQLKNLPECYAPVEQVRKAAFGNAVNSKVQQKKKKKGGTEPPSLPPLGPP